MDRHSFSLVIVSDYAPGKIKGWQDLGKMMFALAPKIRAKQSNLSTWRTPMWRGIFLKI